MKAKTINETNFERDLDPKRSMKIGIGEKLDMMKGMSAMTHWLYNADSNFIEKVWGGTFLKDHLESKLKGLINKQPERYISANVLMKFIRELDDENTKKLYEYIIENHTDKW